MYVGKKQTSHSPTTKEWSKLYLRCILHVKSFKIVYVRQCIGRGASSTLERTILPSYNDGGGFNGTGENVSRERGLRIGNRQGVNERQ